LTFNGYTSASTPRERRFLAVGKDANGTLVHVIVHSPTYSSIHDGAKKAVEFLQQARYMEITFMVNLDTGAQDVFELHNSDCSVNGSIKGQLDPSKAVNLLAYYFK
jgi:hypothetical protein